MLTAPKKSQNQIARKRMMAPAAFKAAQRE
jgi:hypothetical protein